MDITETGESIWQCIYSFTQMTSDVLDVKEI